MAANFIAGVMLASNTNLERIDAFRRTATETDQHGCMYRVLAKRRPQPTSGYNTGRLAAQAKAERTRIAAIQSASGDPPPA